MAQSTNVATFSVVLTPADGATTMAGAHGTFYLDNYNVYADVRNDQWLAMLNGLPTPPSPKNDEASVRITPTGLEGQIAIGALPGEPEAFSVTFLDTLTLQQVSSRISNLVGERSGGVIGASQTNVKWAGNKNGDYEYYGYHYAESFLVNDPDLLGTAAVADAATLKPIDLPHSKTSKLWFSLTVPEAIAPDVYRGEITITHAGGSYTVPVSVEVYDFALSAQAAIKAGIYAKMQVAMAQDWRTPAGAR